MAAATCGASLGVQIAGSAMAGAAGYCAENLVAGKSSSATGMATAAASGATGAMVGVMAGKVAEVVTTNSLDTSPWYIEDGITNYPPNNGAVEGSAKNITLKQGTNLTRFGKIGETSNFVTKATNNTSKLCLPPNTNPNIKTNLKVLKDIPNVEKSKIAPWGGEKGGGTQYILPETIKNLKKQGYLEY